MWRRNANSLTSSPQPPSFCHVNIPVMQFPVSIMLLAVLAVLAVEIAASPIPEKRESIDPSDSLNGSPYYFTPNRHRGTSREVTIARHFILDFIVLFRLSMSEPPTAHLLLQGNVSVWH